jgi:hypothetical protein
MHRKVKFEVEKIKSYQERGVGGLNYIFYKDASYDRMFRDAFESYTPGEAIELTGRQRDHAG